MDNSLFEISSIMVIVMTDVFLCFGLGMWQLRDFDMCIVKNEEAIRIEPQFAECYGNMANALKVCVFFVLMGRMMTSQTIVQCQLLWKLSQNLIPIVLTWSFSCIKESSGCTWGGVSSLIQDQFLVFPKKKIQGPPALAHTCAFIYMIMLESFSQCEDCFPLVRKKATLTLQFITIQLQLRYCHLVDCNLCKCPLCDFSARYWVSSSAGVNFQCPFYCCSFLIFFVPICLSGMKFMRFFTFVTASFDVW